MDLKETDKKVQEAKSKILSLEEQVRDLQSCNEKNGLEIRNKDESVTSKSQRANKGGRGKYKRKDY